jgi:hypothetical protein
MAMLWGDWKDAYARVPRILKAMAHYNPSMKWLACQTGKEDEHRCVMRPVLQGVFWCFPKCVEAFKHCRPAISVDDTFLTRKYRGVLLVATSIDGEDRLVPLAFTLVESKNNLRWSWFMHLVHQIVVGPS